MWHKWLPWRSIVKGLAKRHGFVDPIALLARLHRFAEPAEVAAPIELLRAGVTFHARGLMNTGAIQHNLDWVWPYWVSEQFDPGSDSFIPRAFSITHVNLTHRNWTAVGVPDCPHYPLVDPRGLVTPFWDGWSLDAWIRAEDGSWLLPSQLRSGVEQRYSMEDGLAVETRVAADGLLIESRVDVVAIDGEWCCRQRIKALGDRPGELIISLRPANPEGVSFIHHAALEPTNVAWRIDNEHRVEFSAPADAFAVSDYKQSDVHARLNPPNTRREATCDVGMVTAAACFHLAANEPRQLTVRTPLGQAAGQSGGEPAGMRWRHALLGAARLEVADSRIQSLYDTALRTLVLLSPDDALPGPYTYKRFWFRDAAFMIHSLLVAGLVDRAERALQRFPDRQMRNGYFYSQEGEWDSNGQVLWILNRFRQMTGRTLGTLWADVIRRAADWIVGKVTSESLDVAHAGLLPAGFSAEHLGPNDHYYWDDYWSIAGLHAAAEMMRLENDRNAEALAQKWSHAAGRIEAAIGRSLAVHSDRRSHAGIPASPYRRMDAGAIGSIVASYPLQLVKERDPDLLATVDYLLEYCTYDGAFFQDMIHSGMNPYLTLHLAQVLLRAGGDFEPLVNRVAALASPTGQWPEAVHPRTGGGCMGDGQHGWAAAEWIMMIRNCFVREEESHLILASGLPAPWLHAGAPSRFGPAPTSFGDVTVAVEQVDGRTVVRWDAQWRREPTIEVRLPGTMPQRVSPRATQVEVETVSVV